MLTIITPCFNAERFIAGCIENVLHQQVSGIEHLIMDGGSRDRTVEIVRGYAERHPHLRLISEADRGQSDAMNKGIRLANHQTIGFLNADDAYLPGTLKRILTLIPEQPPLHFLVGNCVLRNLGGQDLCVNRPVGMRFDRLLLSTRRYPFPSNPAAYFYDKRIHDAVGLYDEKLRYTMDLEFLLRMARVAAIRHVDETWGVFTLHDDAKTANAAPGAQERATWQARFLAELSPSERRQYRIGKALAIGYEGLWRTWTLSERIRSRCGRMIGLK